MTVRFNQTVDDVLHLTWYYYRSNKALKVIFIVLLAVMIFAITTKALSEDRTGLDYWIYLSAILVAVWAVFIPWSVRRRLNKPANKEHITGNRILVLHEDKLELQTPKTDSSMMWSSFTKLRKTKLCYYLFITEASAVIVPKRAFDDTKEMETFEQLVASYTGKSWK